jgi:prophage maintenance system killer protein
VVNAYGVRSDNTGRSGDDWSYGFSASYPNDKITAQIAWREIQDNFDPALGFVQRDNVRLLRVAGAFNPRPRNFLNIQQMFHDVYFTQFTRLDNGQVESWDVYISALDWHFQSGDNIHGMLDVNPIYERLFEPFEISPGVVLPVAEYRFTRFRTNFFSTANRRRVSGNLSLTWGNYWSGTAEQVNASVTFRLPPRFSASLSTNQTFAHLPEGDFVARIVTANVGYAASPRLSFSNLIQYDNRSRNLGWQGRARWTLTPGSDLFVAFNQGWVRDDVADRRFRPQDSKLSSKRAAPMQVVSGPVGRARVHVEAPAADRLEDEMRQFLEWFNIDTTTEPVLKAAVAHLWFVTIHPFDDGNGRIARAIADMALARSEGNSQRFYSMSAQIREERGEYYRILEQTQRGTLDITAWMEWFLGCLTRAIESTQAALSGVIEKARYWEKLRDVALNERQRLVINRLLEGFEGNLTTSKWAALTKSSTDTALRDIQQLVERGVLVRNRAGGRSTSYSLAR